MLHSGIEYLLILDNYNFQLNFQIPIPIIEQSIKIQHQEKIMLLGSCFTETIGSRLQLSKFDICSNPNGILFNPLSIVNSLNEYLEPKGIIESDLFYLNEIWNHWSFHSRFSHFDKEKAVQEMNASIKLGAQFLKSADWLVITLGSAFQYFLKENSSFQNTKMKAVANCHRANAAEFEKKILEVSELICTFKKMFQSLSLQNPKIKILFTVSPVRHIRDGLTENNHSKARLLELVHHFTKTEDNCFYFPSYELIIDVLRDYRFYEADMVHPNRQAIQFVWDYFVANFMTASTQDLLRELEKIQLAFNHKPRFQDTHAHLKLKENYFKKIMEIKANRPYLNMEQELKYFSKSK